MIFSGISQTTADVLRSGTSETTDANNQTPEIANSDGNSNPCRVCLELIAKNDPYLVLAHRPFCSINPYTELGPVFIHADNCRAYTITDEILPPVLHDSSEYLVRGYNSDERIVYGSGKVVP